MIPLDILSVSKALVMLMVPAILFMVALHARRKVRNSGVQRLVLALALMLGCGVIAAAMYVLMNPHQFNPWISDMFAVARAALILLLLGFTMLAIVLVWGRRRVIEGLAAALITLWMGFGMLVLPALGCDGINRGTTLNTLLQCPDSDMAARAAGGGGIATGRSGR